MSTRLTSKSITVSKENYKKLCQLGYADETVDNVIGRMLEVVEQVTENDRN